MKIKVGTGVPKHLLKEMEKDKPSAKSEYWAKSGCKNCHGTGIIGVTTMVLKGNNRLKNEELCSCARKKWQKWQDDWYKARQDATRKARDEAKGNGNGKPKPVEAKTPDKQTLSRVQNIDNCLSSLWSAIHGLQTRVDELPHHAVIASLSEQLEACQASLKAMTDVVDEKERAADRLDVEIEDMLVILKNKRRRSASLQQEVENDRGGPLADSQSSLKALTSEKAVAERELSRSSHQSKKKIREARDRIDRLDARRHKIIKEAGLTPEAIQESFELDESDDPTTENHTSL